MFSFLRLLRIFANGAETAADDSQKRDDEGSNDRTNGKRLPSTSPSQPNFLFIVTDQQRHDTLGVVQEMMPQYRNKLHVRTPNIDRLARNGAIFEKGTYGST